MITKLRIQNFKALRDVELALTPIHVLIGPNDSGKTSILDALAALCRSVDHDLADAFLASWKGLELVWSGQHGSHVAIEADFGAEQIRSYGVHIEFARRGRQARVSKEVLKMGQQSGSYNGPPAPDAFAGSTRVRCEAEGPGWPQPEGGSFRRVKPLLEGGALLSLGLSIPCLAGGT